MELFTLNSCFLYDNIGFLDNTPLIFYFKAEINAFFGYNSHVCYISQVIDGFHVRTKLRIYVITSHSI